jgi:hypothetical protein
MAGRAEIAEENRTGQKKFVLVHVCAKSEKRDMHDRRCLCRFAKTRLLSTPAASTSFYWGFLRPFSWSTGWSAARGGIQTVGQS